MSAKIPAASTPVPAATPQVVITPLKPALIANHAHTLPVLVRVQALVRALQQQVLVRVQARWKPARLLSTRVDRCSPRRLHV